MCVFINLSHQLLSSQHIVQVIITGDQERIEISYTGHHSLSLPLLRTHIQTIPLIRTRTHMHAHTLSLSVSLSLYFFFSFFLFFFSFLNNFVTCINSKALRGLKTLHLRMEASQKSAMVIATYLEQHENVLKVSTHFNVFM